LERLVILVDENDKQVLKDMAEKESNTTGFAVTISDLARKALKQYIQVTVTQK